MSDRSLQTLQQIALRESNSLLRYIGDAFPWTTATGSDALERLQAIVRAERDALAALTRYLYRHKMPPPRSGGYPTDFTTLNFIELGYLTHLLTKQQKESIARIESDLASVAAGEGRQLAEALLAVKKKHLVELQHLQKPEPAVMS
jgi:hypothetical protein